MESPAPESPMDGEDAVYPCKGCGEVRIATVTLYGI
jgi:hypothetical protein